MAIGGDGEAGRVEDEGERRPDERDRDAGRSRPDEPDELAGGLEETVRSGQSVARDEQGQERRDRRVEEGIDGAEDDGHDDELPDLDTSADDEGGHDTDHERAQGVRAEDERLGLDAIGDGTAAGASGSRAGSPPRSAPCRAPDRNPSAGGRARQGRRSGTGRPGPRCSRRPRRGGSRDRPAGAGTAPTAGGRGDPWEWPPPAGPVSNAVVLVRRSRASRVGVSLIPGRSGRCCRPRRR